MKKKYNMLLVLMLVAIFGTTLLPFQVIALPDASSSNDSHNYRGFVTISARNTNFLWDMPRSNIRFALWNGKTWIDLPFWIVKPQEYQTHVDMNNTNTNMDRVVYSNRISPEDYFVVVVPNKKGIGASYKNWWPKARKANAFARSKLVIEKQFTNSTSSITYTILDLLFKNKNNDNSIVIYVYYSKNAMFIPTKWDMTKTYFFFDRPASTSSEKNSNSTNTNQELYHKITVSEFTKRFKNIYKVISISDPVKLQTNTLFRTKSNTVTVLKNQILMKFHQFKNTGWHPQEAESFLLPPRTTSISDIKLRIEGVAPKGAYNRYLNITLYHFKSDDTEEVYNLEYTVLTEDEFRYDFTITDKVLYFGDSGYSDWRNYLEITITTWTGGQDHPDEYWVVNASLRYYYSASDTNLTSLKVDLAQPRFDFKHTGWKIVKFPLPLPDNKIFDQDSATVTFDLHFDAVSDPYTRVLKVYLITDVGTQLIYSGVLHPGFGDKYFTLSADQVQDYLDSVTEAQVGIVLTTYVGYWKMTGQVIVKYRPKIFPDNDIRWNITYIPYYHRVGSIFAVDYDAVSDPYTRVLKVYLITDVGTQLIYSGVL
ncbi:MAG: hypothetical protein J7L47_00295, partial [Candidatus Odinarchaeota archaeon]|nr:hypothetical protein [Candidatus Odinarchaeota archaeon]